MNVNYDITEALKALHNCKIIGKGEEIKKGLKEELRRALLDIQRRAQALTPVAEGILKSSAKTEVTLSGDKLKGRITYGGMSSKYAKRQHDDESLRHELPGGLNRTQTKLGKPRKRPIKGYRGGKSHFLHGKSHSAWDSQKSHFYTTVDKEVEKLSKQIMERYD